MSSSSTAPLSPLAVLSAAFVSSAAEVAELRISGGLFSASFRALWVWFKFVAALVRFFLVAFVWLTNAALRIRPVARARRESFWSDTLSADAGLRDIDRVWTIAVDLKSATFDS